MPEAGLLALLATGVAVGAVSAVSPFLPVEAYVAGVALTQPTTLALAAAAGAGLGQTIGKTLLFTSTRATGRSVLLQRLRARARHHEHSHATPTTGLVPLSATPDQGLRARVRRLNTVALTKLGSTAGPWVVLLSATLGVPPMLLVAFYAGASPMTYRAFVAACLVGRTSRFIVLAVVPGLAHS